jgi:hypothetical protein
MTFLIALCLLCRVQPLLAGPATETEGLLSPCSPNGAGESAASDQAAQAWGVEIATAFSEQDVLAQFGRVKQDHADVLGSYQPIVVATCDLHMGTELQYSARIGVDSREDADDLCAKLKAAGGACIVQKN